MQTPVRPTLKSVEKYENTNDTYLCQRATEKRSGNRRPWISSPDHERRASQREKQVSYGYATEGYRNMIKLVEHDPLLKSGGLLPLQPPDVAKGSKRSWDVSLRKWRRALHMFDSVFIDGDDEGSKTLESVIEEQRLQWVSPAFQQDPKRQRSRLSVEAVLKARNSPFVPTKLPVEENLKIILRSEDCYEPVSNIVPQSASSLIKGTDISPLDAGIKIHVAPSAHSQSAATPGKGPVNSFQETPQPVRPSASALDTKEMSPKGVHLFASPATCQTRPEAFSVRRAPSSTCQSLAFEMQSCTPFTHAPQMAPPAIAFQPAPPRWDCVFAPPSYMPYPTHAPSASPAEMERMQTPTTAPRRITFLQSSGRDRRIGDVETLQRNLFPGAVTPPTRHLQMKKKSPSVSTDHIPVNRGKGLDNESTKHYNDSVSQQLFPEQ